MSSRKLRCIFFLFSLLVLIDRAEAQLIINTEVSPDDLVQTLVGTGVTYSNVTYAGGPLSRGTFSGPSNLGIPAGVVLSTGNANTIPQAPGGGGMGGSSTNVVVNDPDMNLICNSNDTQNGSILEFDFIPQGSQLVFKYVFASEEYNQYAPPCSSGFNDGFGFFISGPGISGPYSNSSTNIALLPSSTNPVSINNVNCVTNNQYYIPNYNGAGSCAGCGNEGKITDPNFVFNAYTVVFEATIALTPCTTYHIKLGVANVSDGSMQSGVFLQESSFSSNPITVTPVYNIPSLDTTMVEGCNNIALTFGIDTIPTLPVIIPLVYGGTAINGVDFPLLPVNAIIPVGSQTTSILINPYDDGIAETAETLTITYSNVTCNGSQNETTTFYINDYPPLQAMASNDVSVNCSEAVNVSIAHTGGIVPYEYLWNTGDTTGSFIVTPTVTTTYTCQISDGCGSFSSDSVKVTVLTPLVDAGPDLTTCSATPVAITGNALNFLDNSQLWTHTGAGFLSGVNAFSPTYTPAAGESGTIKLKLSVGGLGGCAGLTYSDSLYLQIDPMPQPNAGFDANACSAVNYTFNGSAVNHDPAAILWTHNGTSTLLGNTTLTPVYTPSVGQLGIVSFVMTVKGVAACSTKTVTDTVKLNFEPPPTVQAGPATAICASSTYTLASAQALNCQTVTWQTSGDGSFDNLNSINPVYVPGPGDIATGSVLLTFRGDGSASCSVLQSFATTLLTIHPLPTANAGINGATCQGIYHTVSGASATNNSSVTWTEDGPGSLINAGSLTPTYVPLPDETGTVTLTLTSQGANTCSAVTAISTRTLTVNPLPAVDAGADATICAANTYTLNGTQLNCLQWLWTTSGNGTFSNPNLPNPVYRPGTTDIATGSATLTLTGQGTGACLGLTDIDQMTLFIDPMPTAYAGIDDAFCVLNPINDTGASATNYTSLQWSGGDGVFNNNTLVSPTYMPGNVDFNNGTVTLTLRAQGSLACSGQFATDSRVFSVSPYPIVSAGPDDYICSNVTQYTLAGTGNNYNLGNIQWTVSGGDGTLSNPNILNPVYFAGPIDLSTPDRNIIFTLTMQGIGNCSGVLVNDQVILKIDPTPISNAGPDDEVCGQRPYQLNPTAQFQNTINWITSGTGTFSDPNILNPMYLPSAADVGTTVVLTLGLSGCQSLTNGDFMWLTVHPDPTAIMSGTTNMCEGNTTPISIAFTGTPPWNVTYTNGITPITVNNINTSPYTFSVSPAISTTWMVTSANDAFCTVPPDSIHGLAAVSVYPLPDLFLVTGSNQGYYCEGDTGVQIGLNNSQLGMNYTLMRNGLSSGITLPGTGSALIFGLFATPGQYSVQGVNPIANCLMMMNDTITVIMNPIPVTDFSTNLPCTSDTTYFTLSGEYLPRSSTWFWDFGDGTYATYSAPYSPSHVYPTYSTYTVTLSVVDTNGCHYTVTHPVEVLPHPNAFFSTNTPNCLDGTTHFTDLSGNPPGQGYLEQWIWTFGDGTPNDTTNFPNTPNINHTYTSSGTYPVTFTVRNNRGCSSFYQSTVTVTNRPIAGFDYFSNCEDQNALFTDNSNENLGGQITAWSWDFGDPTTGALNTSILQNPEHLYTATGDFIVKLIVHNLNGCRDSIQDTVHVKAAPLANFFSSAGCQNSPTQFLADSTLMNIGATATYAWDFGDGGTAYSRNSYYPYLAPGTYSVKLTITDTAGCEGFKLLPLIVTPPPTAHFTATTDNCQGQSVPFTDLSTANSGFLTTWHWDFGDGNNQTIPFPQPPNTNHTYSGTGIDRKAHV